jgi:hypothetical protein
MTNNKQQTPHGFCETPEQKCTMNYCDENGCQNRKRTLVEPIEMTNNKQQTLVEWIRHQVKQQGITHYFSLREILLEAEKMEKGKHEKFNKFLNLEKELGISDLKTIERIQWYYNTYFNETYKEVTNETIH